MYKVILLFLIFLIHFQVFSNDLSKNEIDKINSIHEKLNSIESIEGKKKFLSEKKKNEKNTQINYYLELKYVSVLNELNLNEAKSELTRLKKQYEHFSPYLQALYEVNWGVYFFSIGDCSSIDKHYAHAEKKLKEINQNSFKKNISDLIIIGKINAFTCKSEYKKALELLQQNEKLLNDFNNKETFLFFQGTLGFIHFNSNNYQDAIKCYEKMLHFIKVKKLKDEYLKVSIYNDLSACYYYAKNKEKAIYYSEKAFEIFQKIPVNEMVVSFLTNYAYISMQEGSYKKAEELYLYLIEKTKEINHKKYNAYGEIGLAKLYLKEKKYKEAEKLFLKNILFLKSEKDFEMLISVYNDLLSIYSKNDNSKQIIQAQKEIISLNDSLNIQKDKEIIQEINAKYENEKKSAELKSLKKINSQKNENIKQKNFIIFLIVLISTLLFVLILIFIRLRNKINRNKEQQLASKLARLQINPHFLNNAFTTIQAIALKNKLDFSVINFIASISRYSRLILESSINENWTLHQELDLIANYASIMQNKFPNNWEVLLKIDENLKNNETLIPTALSQSLIENIFEHSVFEDKKSVIEINAFEEKKTILLTFKNEIGEIKNNLKRKEGEVSQGLEILQKRVYLFNQKFKQQIEIKTKQENQFWITTILIHIK